ncbi:hypothetical protein GCM10023168_21630 [Fodinibacter luteus]|uniref:WD40 repeat protein n=1 Tax=Fodinibacter luteus TaxID=552064 RepID=A0ABP8KH92_9MICO
MLEQLVSPGRVRRRAVVVAGLTAAAVLVLVLAGLSFEWAGRSGRALEPVPANSIPTPTPTPAASMAFPSELHQWIDALPAGAPPATPYWHDGVLYINGEQIPAPFVAVDLRVSGDTVLVGGDQSEPQDGDAPTAWALVRGDRLQPLPVPDGAHPPGLSVDGRIAYWVNHQENPDRVEFFTWDTEANTALATYTLQRNKENWDGRELLGIDAAGNGYWKASLADPYLTRWDIRAGTLHPTELAYDMMEGPETFDLVMPWMHPGEQYRSPDGTKEMFTASIPSDSPSDCCIHQLRVRPVGPDESLDPQDVITLPPSEPELAERYFLGEGEEGYWTWWESDESVLITVDADLYTYLLRCSATGAACERVADLGSSDIASKDSYPSFYDWMRNWAFARAPVSR